MSLATSDDITRLLRSPEEFDQPVFVDRTGRRRRRIRWAVALFSVALAGYAVLLTVSILGGPDIRSLLDPGFRPDAPARLPKPPGPVAVTAEAELTRAPTTPATPPR